WRAGLAQIGLAPRAHAAGGKGRGQARLPRPRVRRAGVDGRGRSRRRRSQRDGDAAPRRGTRWSGATAAVPWAHRPRRRAIRVQSVHRPDRSRCQRAPAGCRADHERACAGRARPATARSGRLLRRPPERSPGAQGRAARRRTNRGSGAFGRDQRAHPRPRPGRARARRPPRPPAGLRRAFHRSELTARMRVISGTARGRHLRAAAETRPTADLIKGSIFSMLEALAYKRGFEPDEDGNLAAALAWPRVLDLFAGSGGLGIEALSRGALPLSKTRRHGRTRVSVYALDAPAD